MSFQVPEPQWLTSCNCSLCRRLGSLWGYFARRDVVLTRAENATQAYIQGDRMLATHHCVVCGCTTHWEGFSPEDPDERMGINFRLCDPADIAHIRIRRIDGADTWQFLDE